ncbi:MAG: hypothetical protein V4467_03465 [Patescibacteria group bacterium]
MKVSSTLDCPKGILETLVVFILGLGFLFVLLLNLSVAIFAGWVVSHVTHNLFLGALASGAVALFIIAETLSPGCFIDQDEDGGPCDEGM